MAMFGDKYDVRVRVVETPEVFDEARAVLGWRGPGAGLHLCL